MRRFVNNCLNQRFNYSKNILQSFARASHKKTTLIHPLSHVCMYLHTSAVAGSTKGILWQTRTEFYSHVWVNKANIYNSAKQYEILTFSLYGTLACMSHHGRNYTFEWFVYFECICTECGIVNSKSYNEWSLTHLHFDGELKLTMWKRKNEWYTIQE